MSFGVRYQISNPTTIYTSLFQIISFLKDEKEEIHIGCTGDIKFACVEIVAVGIGSSLVA